nr:retrotransposon protein, putative, unclassified [Tanacetum cinerariifolium]
MMDKISFFLGLDISQTPRGIFINQSKYALESLKKYCFESCDLVDTPMVEKSKLDEDKQGKAIDPSHYRVSSTEAEYIALSRCCAQILWMRSQLTDYGLGFNKIPITAITKGLLPYAAIMSNTLGLNISKSDTTLSRSRDRIEFLINKLGMKSFTPETLKQLTDEVDE